MGVELKIGPSTVLCHDFLMAETEYSLIIVIRFWFPRSTKRTCRLSHHLFGNRDDTSGVRDAGNRNSYGGRDLVTSGRSSWKAMESSLTAVSCWWLQLSWRLEIVCLWRAASLSGSEVVLYNNTVTAVRAYGWPVSDQRGGQKGGKPTEWNTGLGGTGRLKVFPNMCNYFLTLLAVITQWKMDRALPGVKRRVHAAFLCPAFEWFMLLLFFVRGCFDIIIIKLDGVLFSFFVFCFFVCFVLEIIKYFWILSDMFLGLVRYFWYHFVNVCRSLAGEVDCFGIYILALDFTLCPFVTNILLQIFIDIANI